MNVNYFIVVDNPESERVDSVVSLRRDNAKVIVNDGNMGAHLSRNVGFDAGRSEFVLFLDDDVEPDPGLLQAYALVAAADSAAPGFVGVAGFPPPINSATKGVIASDILTFWDIARTRASLPWGVTANLLVRRSSAEDIRFSSQFPKWGGGEDVDYCLRIIQRAGKWFASAPGAVVTHPWWNGGSRQYRRFARWAYGDSRLPVLHPQYKFRNAPNMLESLLLGLLAFGVLAFAGLFQPWKIVAWVFAVILAETAVEIVRLKARWKSVSVRIILEEMLVRLSNDAGRIVGHVGRGHIVGITERFDYFMTGESIWYERKVAATKVALFILAAFVVVFAA